MANIRQVKDDTNQVFYPQTHEKAVIDSNGVNLQTKLQNIATPTYVTAWDGASTPVVANIPAGVTVTYDGTDYTGTLAASASTANKTYLVSTGTTDNYNRYVTQLNGSTYSWQNLGSTEIGLSGYATKDEFEEVNDKLRYSVPPKSAQYNKIITYADGSVVAGTSKNMCVISFPVIGGNTYYIDGRVPSATGACLYAFYDENNTFISGSAAITTTGGYESIEVVAPLTAKSIKVSGNAQPSSYPYNPSVKQSVTINDLVDVHEVIGGWVMGKCMKNNQGVGNTCPKTAETWATHRYAVLAVNSNYRYVINGTGTATYRLWSFLNSSNVILSVDSGANTVNDNSLVLIPPLGATQLILNTLDTDGLSYIVHPSVDQSTDQKIERLETRVENDIASAKNEAEQKATLDHNSDIFLNERRYTMTFTAGTNHSSASDQMKINIPAGASFGAMFVSGTADFSTTRSLYAFYADGTNESLGAMTRGNHYFKTAKKDIVAFGNYSAGSDITTSGTMGLAIWNNDARENGQNIFAFNEDAIVKQYLTQIRKTRTGSAKSIVSLLHFSDLHGDDVNLSRIVAFASRYGSYLDDVVATGDNVYNIFSNSFTFWGTAGAGGFLSVIGNHDAWSVDGGPTVATEQECYEKFFAPYIDDWGVTGVVNKCYYYKDYNTDGSYPVRLIVLDCMHLNEDQTSWLTSTLASAKTNGYTVVIAVHYTPSPMHDSTVDKTSTFTCYEASSNSTSWATVVAAESIVQDFIDGGGKFACWLCGHYHTDIFGRSEHGQLFIAVERANTVLAGTYDARVNGTKTRDSFNVFAIDAAAGYIRLFRVGNDVDRTLRPKVSLCYDYVNGVGIYNCGDANTND